MLQTAAVLQTAVVPQTPIVVKERSFGTFSWTVTLLLILFIFCVMYFYVRRKKSPKHIDEKAGDEGED